MPGFLITAIAIIAIGIIVKQAGVINLYRFNKIIVSVNGIMVIILKDTISYQPFPRASFRIGT